MRIHIVQKGDTLWKIAKQYAIGFDELKRLNAHLANPDYIVPGMEIYLPAMQKEKEAVKEKPVQQPAATSQEQAESVQQPTWQGDVYFQPQMPMQPMPVPMQMPHWQHTHVHVEPTIEQTMMMPQMIPQQQMPQMQPMQMPQMMPQMMPMQPIFMPMPQQPMPICMCCHGVRMDEQMMTSPIQREESSRVEKKCAEQDARVQQYYEEIQQITQQPGRSCAQMMPVQQPMPCQQMMPMHPTMHPTMHPAHPMMPWHM